MNLKRTSQHIFVRGRGSKLLETFAKNNINFRNGDHKVNNLFIKY